MGFSTLKIEGNCDVNYIWTKEEGLTESDVNDITALGICSPTWDNQTVMLSLFNGSLYASDINVPVIGYIIQRQKVGEKHRKNIAKVSSGITSICDFNVENRAEYKYFIIPIYNSGRTSSSYGEPFMSDEVATAFDSWSIIGLKSTGVRNEFTVDKKNIWNFYVNVQAEDFSLNSDKTVSNNLGQYPKIYRGDADYITGGLSCQIGNVGCPTMYTNDNIEKLRQWRRFCNNGDIKLLRDPKGHIIPCDITDVPTYNVEYQYGEMPTTINFKYTQLANSDNIVVYTNSDM